MKRRDFITLLGGAATWPLAARAQQPVVPVIGFLTSASAAEDAFLVEAFRSGLGEAGFIEGQHVRIEFRPAENDYGQLPALAAELVRYPVSVLVASGGTVCALAAKAATATIPIVFTTGADPVASGLVASLNRPGGNITGVSRLNAAVAPKRLELLREMLPKGAGVAFLRNPKNPNAEAQLSDVQSAAHKLGQALQVLTASNESEIETAFATLAGDKAEGLIIDADPLFQTRREQLAILALRNKLASIYSVREYPVAGGLMSYGSSVVDAHRQVGIYTARILKGEKPGDLPVLQPTKFELIINLKTAKALGISVPLSLQVAADEVIE